MSTEIGKLIRLRRILAPETGKAVVVAFDHGLSVGTVAGLEAPRQRLGLFHDAGVDAVLVTPGLLRQFGEVLAGSHVGIIVRLDWTNMWRGAETLGFDEGRGCAIAAVEDAVRWGADAVITFMFLGLNDAAAEAAEVRRNAEVNRACERLGIVHIVESMARGKRVIQANTRELVALHTRIAGELGADLIKTDLLASEAETAQVVSASLVPVLFAGGAKMDEHRLLETVASLMRAGAAGVIFGRNVFQSADPVSLLASIRRLVHSQAHAAVSL
jgi:DhnA family fructose-bisphosphate aldolase class Ia